MKTRKIVYLASFCAVYIKGVSKDFEYTGGNQSILPLVVVGMLQKTKDGMFIFWVYYQIVSILNVYKISRQRCCVESFRVSLKLSFLFCRKGGDNHEV